jgi:hypothetical protein
MSAPSDEHTGDEPLAPERLARLEAALAGLERRRAPTALKARVADTLAAADSELESRAVASLALLDALAAPAELRERVNLELSTETPIAHLLGNLERVRAPHVLRRLVDEDVALEHAPVERVLRGLPRLAAPAHAPIVLHAHVEGAARVRFLRLAAAAVVLIAVGAATIQLVPDEPAQRRDRPAFRLERSYANSLDELSSMGRGLALGLAGDSFTAGGVR